MMMDGLRIENGKYRSRYGRLWKEAPSKKSFETPTIEQKGKQKGENANRGVTGENVDGGKRRKGRREGILPVGGKT